MKKILNKLLYAGFFFCLIVALFLAIVGPVVGRKNKILDQHNNKYNVVLSLKYGYLDKGFNQQAIEGVCDAFAVLPQFCNGESKLFQEGKISYGYAGTMDSIALIKEYVDNFAETEKVNHFITPGFTYSTFLKKWLFDDRQYFQDKGINFIAIGTALGASPGKSWPKNFWQLLFEEYLPGYYAGLYAGAYALMNPDQFKDGNVNKKGKQIHFASLGGLWISPIARYALGFKLGVDEVNDQRQVISPENGDQVELLVTNYRTTGSFDNSAQSKFDTAKLYREGVSVVFSIAVSLTNANQTAAREEDTTAGKKQHWVIGVDIDQGVSINNEDPTSSQRQGNILVSAILKIRQKLADLIQDLEKGTVTGENILISSSKYLSIPQRFKNDRPWKKVEEVILNQKTNAEPEATKINLMRLWIKKAFEDRNQDANDRLLAFLNAPTSRLQNQTP